MKLGNICLEQRLFSLCFFFKERTMSPPCGTKREVQFSYNHVSLTSLILDGSEQKTLCLRAHLSTQEIHMTWKMGQLCHCTVCTKTLKIFFVRENVDIVRAHSTDNILTVRAYLNCGLSLLKWCNTYVVILMRKYNLVSQCLCMSVIKITR